MSLWLSTSRHLSGNKHFSSPDSTHALPYSSTSASRASPNAISSCSNPMTSISLGASASRKLSASVALPPQARSSARNAKWPPTTGLALNSSPGGYPPFSSVSYRSVNGLSVLGRREISCQSQSRESSAYGLLPSTQEETHLSLSRSATSPPPSGSLSVSTCS